MGFFEFFFSVCCFSSADSLLCIECGSFLEGYGGIGYTAMDLDCQILLKSKNTDI